MAVIPWQNVTTAFAQDAQTLVIYWGPFNGGDEGQPIGVYAYEWVSWQFTGNPVGGILTNPLVPILPSRKVTLLGTLDRDCWGEVFTLNANPAGMDARTGDPLRSGFPDHQFVQVKPVIGGDVNPEGPDCGFLLFGAKLFGPRSG